MRQSTSSQRYQGKAKAKDLDFGLKDQSQVQGLTSLPTPMNMKVVTTLAQLENENYPVISVQRAQTMNSGPAGILTSVWIP